MFIRLVNNEVIQTVYPNKYDPLYIDVNIGMYSVYERIMPHELKEGNIEFSRITKRQYELYETGYELSFENLVKDFRTTAVPILRNVIDIKSLIEFDYRNPTFHGILHNMFETFIKIESFTEALKLAEFLRENEIEGLKIIKKCIAKNEGVYTFEDIKNTQNYINEFENNISAIKRNDMSYLNLLVSQAKQRTKELLMPYGIIL